MDLARHWGLEPGLHYLNHGSFGACPVPVLEAQSRLRAEMEANMTRFMIRELMDRMAEVRGIVADFVGSRPEDLVFVRNATMGVNAVLRSWPFAEGDELLVCDHEYPASRNALDYVAERSGARVVEAEVPFPIASEEQVLEALHAKVGPRTRMLLVDHITSATALVLPIERIVREMKERGVETLVDGAHGPGQVPLDLSSLGALAYTGNCHKWLMAPKGAAILWVREDLQDRVRPTSISHGATDPLWGGHCRFQAAFDWLGTDDPTPMLCLPAAIGFLRGLDPAGLPALRSRMKEMVLEGRRLLCEALGIGSPAPESMLASMATVPLPDHDGLSTMAEPDPLLAFLHERRLEPVIQSWPAPPRRILRISAAPYNRPEQFAWLADCVGEFFSKG